MKSFLDGKKSLPVTSLFPASGAVLHRASLPKNGHSHDSGSGGPTANVEIVKEGDRVVRIFVTCKCGERLEIECLYPAGA
jgi:hypothetical protein